jgi:uncharacterized phage protein gp47/JayE
MPGVTSTGWESKSLLTIKAEMTAAMLANISANLDMSEDTLPGQLVGCSASQISQLWEAGQALYAARDPEQATDDALDALLKLVVGPRRAATSSTVDMTITLAAGTYDAGDIIVYQSGNPDVSFTNDEQIVTAGATLIDQPFTCTVEGAISANFNTLTQTSSTGVSSPNNPAAASPGLERETDSEYRQRWRESLARRGSTTVDAIRADLLAVENVTACKVLENVTDTVDANGIPSRAIAAYVLGGTSSAIAEALWEAKPAGIQTHGSTSVNHTDSQGVVQVVKFTVPTEVPVYVAVTVTAISGQYPAQSGYTVEQAVHRSSIFGNYTTLDEALEPVHDGSWGIGENVIINKIRGAIMRMPGIVDITSLLVDTVDPPVASSNITIDVDEWADIDFADIDVTVNYVTAAP